MKGTQFLLLLQLIAQVGAFTIQQFAPPITTQLKAAPSSIEELISTPASWDPIKKELDHVPVFSCANDQGQPLQYNMGGGPIAFFFCDINAAKEELEKAKTETKLDGLNLLPFPLGEVFEMGAKQMAAIIPSTKALEAAGAPQGLNPMGQQVPLFGCMEIAATQPDGTTMTPLFFTYEEAENAMNMALKEAGGGDAKFEVTVMPLVKSVQTMATNSEKSFIFEAPEDSLNYLRSTME
jgi:hypothetical protein